jgi:HEAT repeat protein
MSMLRNLSKVGLMVLLAVGVLAWALPAHAVERSSAREEKKSIPEQIVIAKNKTTAHPKDRVDAIRALGALNDAGEVRDQRVVDVLCDIAKDPKDDLFVRMETMNSLGNLQFSLFQTDGLARNKYTMPFVSVLKNPREEELIQTKVAQVFARTLPPDDLQAKQAITSMADIAKTRTQSLMLRVACVDALSEIGSPDSFDAFSAILAQADLDQLLQERVLGGMASLLGKITNPDFVAQPSLATVNRIIELVFSNRTPVEIRAQGYVALARMKKSKMIKTLDLQPRLIKILKEEDNGELVVAAITAIGILDEAGATPALIAAYGDFFDSTNPTREADVKIRVSIVKTLGDLVNSQAGERNPDANTISQTAELFLKIIDTAQENTEVETVKDNAIFGLRYYCHKKPLFQRFHQRICQSLILLLRKNRASGSLPPAVLDTLTFVSRYPGGNDLLRWEKWYDKTYPANKLPKEELP